jgi:hypothetical protein
MFLHHFNIAYWRTERTKKGMPCKKFATPRLFFETMPIYKAVASGNGNIEFYRETTHANLKVHKIEIFFGFDFEICIISLLVM